MSNSKNLYQLTVIVAAYNQEDYIGRCLRSLLAQSMPHKDYQIIVVDDGSTDKTPYTLSQFVCPGDSVLKIITLPENRGLPSALNAGILASNSKYIVRVDSDDFVNKRFLDFLYYYLETNSTACDAVACDYLLIDESENVLQRCSARDNPIACGILFKTECLIKAGLYDESFLRHEERELRIRFEKSYSIHHLDVPLYRYRQHSTNITLDSALMEYHSQRIIDKHGTLQ